MKEIFQAFYESIVTIVCSSVQQSHAACVEVRILYYSRTQTIQIN